MQVLIKKSTGNPIEIIDGALIETDTPTLFTHRATVDSIHDAIEFTLNRTFPKQEYEMADALLKISPQRGEVLPEYVKNPEGVVYRTRDILVNGEIVLSAATEEEFNAQPAKGQTVSDCNNSKPI